MVPCYASSIGTIKEASGSTIEIKRKDQALPGKVDASVESMDIVNTGNSSANIAFIDNTKVVVKENSKLLIDDFVFDPKKSDAGKLGLKVTLGTVRYASGQIAKSNAQNVNIETPTAQIAVRGTDFNMVVDELGRSLVVLVPSCNTVGGKENCYTGKIIVKNDGGETMLDQPYQATYVATAGSAPTNPAMIKDITDNQINNLLIIAVPKSVRQAIIERNKKKDDKEDDSNEAMTVTPRQFKKIDETVLMTKKSELILEERKIIVDPTPGKTKAYRPANPSHYAEIKMPDGMNAEVTIIMDGDVSVERIGNASQNKITIRQSK
jgi:hypothetical protein